MSEKIMFKLNQDMYEYIGLQRTGIKGERIEERYYASVLSDYKSIRNELNSFETVLDIGCGLAGIDYFLAKHNPAAKIYLLDATKKEKNIYYGYADRGCNYNDLTLALGFLKMNGIENDLMIYDIFEEFEWPKVDLVISLISWGFHYPVETYLDQVVKILNEGGLIIIDIRKNISPDPRKLFEDRGFKTEIIQYSMKYLRIKAYKK